MKLISTTAILTVVFSGAKFHINFFSDFDSKNKTEENSLNWIDAYLQRLFNRENTNHLHTNIGRQRIETKITNKQTNQWRELC